MEYIDFLNKLYIKGLKYKKTDFTKDLKYTKAGFTENLFLHSVKNFKTVTSKRTSESVFKGYNRGNSIANIAIDIIGDLDEDRIKSFIEDYISSKPNERSKNEQTLCDNFRAVISDISKDNLYERITTFYIDEVLKPAANSATKVGKMSVDVNTESRTIPIPEIGSVEVSVDNNRCNSKSSSRPDSNDEIELVEALAEPLNQIISTPIEIADRQNINYSYSISLDEEKEIRNICKAIINNLDGLKRNVERVNSYKRELVKSPDSESNNMNEYYESHIKSKEKEFNKIYPVFVLQCAALNSKLAPKMYMNKSFAKLISITSFFISDENKEMSIDRFAETHIQVKVYDLQTYIKYSLKEIDMQ